MASARELIGQVKTAEGILEEVRYDLQMNTEGYRLIHETGTTTALSAIVQEIEDCESAISYLEALAL